MQNHLHYDCLDSTSIRLKQLIATSAKPLDAFFTITAGKQERGRGRQTKSWESEPEKNLLMSVLLYPKYAPQQQFYVCRSISLAVVEFLSKQIRIENVSIKWPNDIYVGNKKIAGILIEHFLQGNKINYSIAGVGLNVNQGVFSENLPNPTSIFLETNKEFSPFFCMEELMKNIKELSKTDFAALEETYEQFLYKKNEYASFLIPKISTSPIDAKIKGVTENGLLRISDKDDNLIFCSLDEVVYL